MDPAQNRSHTALVLVDLQRWIVELPLGPRGGPAVVEACERLRTALSAAEAEVVLVRYARADGRDGGPAAPATQLMLPILPGDHVVTKYGQDAFEGTDLHRHLTRQGVTTVVIAGIATAHGVAATARTAATLGYRTLVVEDATASSSAAEHRAALRTLRPHLDGLPTVAELTGPTHDVPGHECPDH